MYVSIMPIVEVLVTADDNTNIASKLLEREEFSLWKVAMPFIRVVFNIIFDDHQTCISKN